MYLRAQAVTYSLCFIVIIVGVIVIRIQMQKVKRGLLSPSSRASSIAGDDSIASDNFKNVPTFNVTDQ